MTRALVVDDDRAMVETMAEGLSARGLEVTTLLSADEAFARLVEGDDFDVLVTDLNMRGMNGVELCDRVVRNRPDVPVIVVTAFGSMDTAVATLRAGAFDFITKPFDMAELEIAVERAAQHRLLREEVKRLRRAAEGAKEFEELVGASVAMRGVYGLIDRVAATDATVLITGETGTGKELAARAIHRRSRRHAAPMVTVNCAAVSLTLLESELFGHVRGAFTDARTDRKGLFVQAEGGTLFLDELGEMPLEMQVKLLRALEARAVRPVGGQQETPFDVRLIAATHRDLLASVEEGTFREDLYYRVDVVELGMPPLRARGADVLLLAQVFLQQLAGPHGKPIRGISPPVAERLLAYAWPGNVRELRNCIERAVAMARFEDLVVEDLPAQVRDYKPSHVLVASNDPSELVSLGEVERRYVERVMQAVGGNKRQAAEVLGLDRTTLYRKLDRWARVPKA
ncbi:MAG TPA: sigma-54 dependent transcriptional regulator [Polyangiaceae bacterium]|nr:sigma-54 dependent transcriptional regulator [Polyangiaceae bacterium]